MSVKNINIQDFSYSLPDEKIARYPLEQRDQSKLLLYHDGNISETVFSHIDEHLPESSLVVFNNTRVIHARILFQRESGAKIEVFCIEPANHADYQLVFSGKQSCTWKCMVGNAKRWKEESLIKQVYTPSGEVTLTATKERKEGELFLVKFSWSNNQVSFAEILHFAGVLPLPPYLNRSTEESDEDRYQTVYASVHGSVAAPTAGLHFTSSVFEKLRAKHIVYDEVTLHVGAGTFKPVKSGTLEAHDMHEETVYIELATIRRIYNTIKESGTVVAVGTTSTRTIESLYWYGVKLIKKGQQNFHISQWDPYDSGFTGISSTDALEAVIAHLEHKGEQVLRGSTKIIIAPGYRFRIVRALITNFHQPENTLILLIAAFTGEDWKRIYEYALAHDFRFLSYGDSSLLWCANAAE